jgi:hypothetical protein
MPKGFHIYAPGFNNLFQVQSFFFQADGLKGLARLGSNAARNSGSPTRLEAMNL